ncbi:MAG: hypothetical protein AAF959_23865 [Cyanobacteria bacterium P01_D01_bin.56]
MMKAISQRELVSVVVQDTHIAHETLACSELGRMEGTIGGESQEEVNGKIVGPARPTSRATRRQ